MKDNILKQTAAVWEVLKMCNSVIYEITTHTAQFFWKLTTSKEQLTFISSVRFSGTGCPG